MSKILVTGSNGLIGHAIRNISRDFPNDDFYFAPRQDTDLTHSYAVQHLYHKVRPDAVIHVAAKVGGIGANLAKPAEFLYENVLMNANVIHMAMIFGVKKLISFSSVCTFPHDIPVLREEDQQAGQPYDGNYAYGWAKRVADVQVRAYNEQYGTQYCSLILTNAYGPHDNWSLENGHVIPSLIHKCYLAKRDKTPLIMWGDGSALREFVYSRDVARCAMKVLKSDRHVDKIIVSSGKLISIKYVAETICDAMGFDGKLEYDTTKSNGRNGVPCDISRLISFMPDFCLEDFEVGIKVSADWFNSNYETARK